MLSCVIYNIIDSYVCIDYLYCQLKTLSEICVDGKYLVKYFNKFLGIGIPYLLIKIFFCHGFTKNIKSIFVLKCPRRKLEYYFSKIFGILERKSNHLKIITNLSKQRTHSDETYDSGYVMTYNTTITYISKTLKKLWLQSSLQYEYIQI